MSNSGWLVSKPSHECEADQCQETKPECKPEYKPEKKECCCKKDMLKALELLFDSKIKDFVKFDEFSFIGKNYLVGTFLEKDHIGNDNTASPFAKLKSIDPCQSDFINIKADGFYYPIPTTEQYQYKYFVCYPVDKASLCNLDAIQFNYRCFPGPLAAPSDSAALGGPSIPGPIFGDSFEEKLVKLLDKKHQFKCSKNDDCCCGDSTFRNIFFIGGYVNLTAGWLALEGAKVLGRIGNILVLSDTSSKKISFVCLESIGFYGPYCGLGAAPALSVE